MNIEEAKKAFADYDRDGDGQISLQGWFCEHLKKKYYN